MRYPIAEIFDSIQGEGVWTGTLMRFVRLAGCNVGEYTEPAALQPLETDPQSLRVLRASYPQHSVCTAFDGTQFLCDTDYHKTATMEAEDIVSALTTKHVCVTGGEPFLHDLGPLYDELPSDVTMHIETSGTKPISRGRFGTSDTWITCSPKAGFVPENGSRVDEWKFVVGKDTDVAKIEKFLDEVDYITGTVFLQPINGPEYMNRDSLLAVMDALQAHPTWRLSAQLNKFLGMR